MPGLKFDNEVVEFGTTEEEADRDSNLDAHCVRVPSGAVNWRILEQ